MSLIVGQNSWCTVIEADSYLTNRISSEKWFLLAIAGNPGETSKETLLVSAFHWLINSAQLQLTPTLTDDNVKKAQIESALFLFQHYEELDTRRAAMATGVTSFRISKRSEDLDINKLQIPSHIIGLLTKYQAGNFIVEFKGMYDA